MAVEVLSLTMIPIIIQLKGRQQAVRMEEAEGNINNLAK